MSDTAEEQAFDELVREIAMGLQVARGGRATDLDLPMDDRRAVPPGSFVRSYAVIVAKRLMAKPDLLLGLARLKVSDGD